MWGEGGGTLGRRAGEEHHLVPLAAGEVVGVRDGTERGTCCQLAIGGRKAYWRHLEAGGPGRRTAREWAVDRARRGRSPPRHRSRRRASRATPSSRSASWVTVNWACRCNLGGRRKWRSRHGEPPRRGILIIPTNRESCHTPNSGIAVWRQVRIRGVCSWAAATWSLTLQAKR